MPDIHSAQSEGQVGVVVEELAEAVMPRATEFQGPQIFVNVPRYEWDMEVHVQGLNEEARQLIMAIEELLHHFSVSTKAREQELHQRLVDS